MSLPVPRIEDPWQQRKPVFIAFGIIGILLAVLWIWGSVVTGQGHPALILRALHDGPGPQPPPGRSSPSTPAPTPQITLFGKVVDDSGVPIPDAEVSITLQDSNGNHLPPVDRTTATDGTFSIHGYRADKIVVVVNKSGYTYVPFPSEGGAISTMEFDYHVDPSLAKRHATAATPLVLTLWQPPRILSPPKSERFRSTAKLDPTGVPHIITVRQRLSPAFHTIELRYWNNKGKGSRIKKNPHSWHATITVPGGTIVEKDPAQVKPEAPSTGYLPDIAIDFPATLPAADWKRDIHRHYYIRFPDDTYGVLTLKLNSTENTLEARLIRNATPNDRDLFYSNP